MKISKIILVVSLLVLATISFANNYQYSIIVFPANVDSTITIPGAPYLVSEAASKDINIAINNCALSYHPQNPLIKFMVDQQKLESSDLDLPIDPANYDRIAQALDADAYCVINVSEFKKDEKMYKTSCLFNVKIIPVGSEEPVLIYDTKAIYTPIDGFWKKLSPESAFEKLVLNFKYKFKTKAGKFNGKKYKPLKQVEKYDLNADL